MKVVAFAEDTSTNPSKNNGVLRATHTFKCVFWNQLSVTNPLMIGESRARQIAGECDYGLVARQAALRRRRATMDAALRLKARSAQVEGSGTATTKSRLPFSKYINLPPLLNALEIPKFWMFPALKTNEVFKSL